MLWFSVLLNDIDFICWSLVSWDCLSHAYFPHCTDGNLEVERVCSDGLEVCSSNGRPWLPSCHWPARSFLCVRDTCCWACSRLSLSLLSGLLPPGPCSPPAACFLPWLRFMCFGNVACIVVYFNILLFSLSYLYLSFTFLILNLF